MNKNRVRLFLLMVLMVFNFTIPVVYAEKPVSEMTEQEKTQKVKQEMERSKKEREKYKHPKVDHLLMELEDEYNKGADDAEQRFYKGEEFKDAAGNVLAKLDDIRKHGGEKRAKEFATKRGRDIKEGKIQVEITLRHGTSGLAFDKKLLAPYGIEDIAASSGNYIWADIPIDKIRKIAEDIDEIAWISAPISISTPDSNQSQGISLLGGVKGSAR